MFAPITRASVHALPLLARLTFAAVLLRYFWSSALTKLDGPFTPTFNAYAQIFPRQMEAAGYDISGFGLWHWAVIMAGSYAELVLPLLILLGLATRLAALGMIGFVIVQSLTDIIGHGVGAATIGALFDRASDGLILDQRALWMFLLLSIVGLGGGWFSLDRVIAKRLPGLSA
ncbi:DoxX family membrane protein [Celeribacter litoreus]|uniref:DoxX family membrane protein n=1 Tax=Celeribacter litoreus TaxID=2876714 RepID=UPI001CC91C56|nr:DoxX family membrane protein [Celeribacter litoreus]MCA0045156.1 DoxX family membrane protein [Celeribacter litoreus]